MSTATTPAQALPRPDTPAHTMTRAQRNANVFGVLLPFVATIAAIVLLWNKIVGVPDLLIFAGMYLLAGLGVTVGYHRLLTHRAFRTHRATEYLLAVLGTMAAQGPVIAWVADHRKHHAHSDHEGDPHSPHTGHGDGARGALSGLWYAHVGWLFSTQGQADWRKYAPDLYEDRGMRWINRHFVGLILLGLAIPAALGFLIGGVAGAATGLLWGGLVRIFFLHHITWSINSICHFLGQRCFETDDHSTNVFWLALPSFGESWHHNHHAFPRSATHGLRWYELDPSSLVIKILERLGLAWNVVRISPERQLQRATEVRKG